MYYFEVSWVNDSQNAFCILEIKTQVQYFKTIVYVIALSIKMEKFIVSLGLLIIMLYRRYYHSVFDKKDSSEVNYLNIFWQNKDKLVNKRFTCSRKIIKQINNWYN